MLNTSHRPLRFLRTRTSCSFAAGFENGNARHPRGLTITIAQNPPENERAFLAAIESAKATAEAEGIPTIFVCKQPPC